MTAYLQMLLWTAIFGVLVMAPAGTIAYPGAWVLLALFAIGGIAMTAWLSKHSPQLLRERMGSPIQRAQKPWDRIFLSSFIMAFAAWMAFSGWDAARTGFTAVSVWLQALGAVGVVAYMLGSWWTFRANVFAAPVVKIQQGQKVIDTGPYAIVRHPMYTSALLMFVGMPLLLGSWIAVALSSVLILGIAWRAVREERTLQSELPGYQDYAARVRYRFVPFVW